MGLFEAMTPHPVTEKHGSAEAILWGFFARLRMTKDERAQNDSNSERLAEIVPFSH